MKLSKKDYDAVVVGSGPNGLAAAVLLQQKGLSVLLLEGKNTIGGGMRTAELTLPGYLHDICSAVHPLAVASPFFETLPLTDYGLEYAFPEFPVAHPFDDGSAVTITGPVEKTAKLLGPDEQAYTRLLQPLVNSWPKIVKDVLAPLHYPEHPLLMARFGLKALTSAAYLSKTFDTQQAKGLFAGLAAHSIQPLTNPTTSAAGLVLMITAHLKGWPVAKRGSQSIANALAAYFTSLGGKIETGINITSMQQLPSANAVLFDITPRQLLQIAGHRFSAIYKWQLERYRYGAGVYKIDWALSEPIPFSAADCRRAGTVHIGNTFNEIALGEQQVWDGKIPQKPFVLLAQQSVCDRTRAPEGKHTAWAYCHVPAGSTVNMTDIIENQVERFAPGFRDTILAKHTMDSARVEEYNPNYIGGDINGGVLNISQLFTRPALRWSPYRASAKGIYICSSSTPPGGGVHGMCGYHSAKQALRDIFDLRC